MEPEHRIDVTAVLADNMNQELTSAILRAYCRGAGITDVLVLRCYLETPPKPESEENAT